MTEGDGDVVQIIQTHEIKTEINSETEAAPNAESNDTNKLSEPEMSSEMTGKGRHIFWKAFHNDRRFFFECNKNAIKFLFVF